MSELGGLINRIRGKLQGEGVPFAIGGSFALAALGHPRFTQDIDIMVLTEGADRLAKAFAGSEFTVINEITYQDGHTGIYLDLLPVLDGAQRAAFDRAQPVALHDSAPVQVLDAEGLILMLLREAMFGDPRKRPLRLRDIELLAADRVVDWGWIEAHAQAAGLDPVLQGVDRTSGSTTGTA